MLHAERTVWEPRLVLHLWLAGTSTAMLAGTPAAIPLQDEVSAVLALDFYLQQSEDEIRV